MSAGMRDTKPPMLESSVACYPYLILGRQSPSSPLSSDECVAQYHADILSSNLGGVENLPEFIDTNPILSYLVGFTNTSL